MKLKTRKHKIKHKLKYKYVSRNNKSILKFRKYTRKFKGGAGRGAALITKKKLNGHAQFYESQESAGCGRHALNNLFGLKYFVKNTTPSSNIDDSNIENYNNVSENSTKVLPLQALCLYIQPILDRVRGNNDPNFCQNSENYDITVLYTALSIIGYGGGEIYYPDKYNTIAIQTQRIGFICNIGMGHWIAIKKINDDNYLIIDSMNSTNQSIKFSYIIGYRDFYRMRLPRYVAIIDVIYNGEYKNVINDIALATLNTYSADETAQSKFMIYYTMLLNQDNQKNKIILENIDILIRLTNNTIIQHFSDFINQIINDTDKTNNLSAILNTNYIQNIIFHIAQTFIPSTNAPIQQQTQNNLIKKINEMLGLKISTTIVSQPLEILYFIIQEQLVLLDKYTKQLNSDNAHKHHKIHDIVFNPVLFVSGNSDTNFAKMIMEEKYKNALFIFNENYENYNSCLYQSRTNASIRSYKCMYKAWGLPTGLSATNGLWTNMNTAINDLSNPKIHGKTPNQIIDEAIDDILRIIKYRSTGDNYVNTIIYSAFNNTKLNLSTDLQLSTDPHLPYIGIETFLSKDTVDHPAQLAIIRQLTEKLSEIPKKLFKKWYEIDIFKIPDLDRFNEELIINPKTKNLELKTIDPQTIYPSIVNINELEKEFKQGFTLLTNTDPANPANTAALTAPLPTPAALATGKELIPLSCKAVVAAT